MALSCGFFDASTSSNHPWRRFHFCFARRGGRKFAATRKLCGAPDRRTLRPSCHPTRRSRMPSGSGFTLFHQPTSQVYSCVLPGEIVRKCADAASRSGLRRNRLRRPGRCDSARRCARSARDAGADAHVFRDRRLTDIHPEFQQFAMNPRRAPRRVRLRQQPKAPSWPVPGIVPASPQYGASRANGSQVARSRKLLKRLDLLGKSEVFERL